MKRYIRASYDIENVDSFPTLEKKVKTSTTINDLHSINTNPSVSFSNEEYTIVSSFSHDGFLKILETN